MPESPGASGNASAPVLRLTVPTRMPFRDVATELARKLAEHLGVSALDADSVGTALEALVGRVAGHAGEADVDLKFLQDGSDLVIHARCEHREADIRCPLPG